MRIFSLFPGLGRAGLALWLTAGLVTAQPAAAAPQPLYLPFITNTYRPPPGDRGDALGFINYYRAVAGVGPVTLEAALNANCLAAAQYIAQTGVMSHTDGGSPAGTACTSQGNLWQGSGTQWTPADTVEGWLSSVAHRLWLLYPTAAVFGYGFSAGGGTVSGAGAALDVLTDLNNRQDFGVNYPDWPIRYPAPKQSGLPTQVPFQTAVTPYPITLSWAYFPKAVIVIGAHSLTAGGVPLAHTADTNLPAEHQGIEILPAGALPAHTLITVSVSGAYNAAPFSYTWSFTTGN